jgi:proteasome accessory factor B
VATARVERLVNLVLCLLSTRQYLTAERIRATVPGYADAPTDEAFFRMFERDKAELRDLGIPLETGRNSVFDTADGYRIARRDYELGDIELAPDEAAAVALAVRLWDSPEFASAARGALLKLRAAGVEVDERSAVPVEPRVRTAELAFAPLYAAVRAGQVVAFDYRRSGAVELQRRRVEPWGVVSWRGHWYLVGHDQDRRATRCFRLSRIAGQPVAISPPGQVQRPTGANLLEIVAGQHQRLPPTRVRVWAAEGRAQGLRRKAVRSTPLECAGVEGSLLELDLVQPEAAASWIAGYGPDVVVVEPETLRKAVHELHLGASSTNGEN